MTASNEQLHISLTDASEDKRLQSMEVQGFCLLCLWKWTNLIHTSQTNLHVSRIHFSTSKLYRVIYIKPQSAFKTRTVQNFKKRKTPIKRVIGLHRLTNAFSDMNPKRSDSSNSSVLINWDSLVTIFWSDAVWDCIGRQSPKLAYKMKGRATKWEEGAQKQSWQWR